MIHLLQFWTDIPLVLHVKTRQHPHTPAPRIFFTLNKSTFTFTRRQTHFYTKQISIHIRQHKAYIHFYTDEANQNLKVTSFPLEDVVAALEVGGADHFGVHPAANEQEQIHKLINGNATKNHIKNHN
jgi:hypothetical protein